MPQGSNCDTLSVEVMMKTLSIREMRASLAQLDKLVNAERELVVTRHGKLLFIFGGNTVSSINAAVYICLPWVLCAPINLIIHEGDSYVTAIGFYRNRRRVRRRTLGRTRIPETRRYGPSRR